MKVVNQIMFFGITSLFGVRISEVSALLCKLCELSQFPESGGVIYKMSGIRVKQAIWCNYGTFYVTWQFD